MGWDLGSSHCSFEFSLKACISSEDETLSSMYDFLDLGRTQSGKWDHLGPALVDSNRAN